MRGTLALAMVLVALACGRAGAEAPATSPRPLANPAYAVAPAATPVLPGDATTTATVNRQGGFAPATSPRPLPRPALAVATVETGKPSKGKKEKPSKKGSVCGDPAIKGEVLAAIKGKVKGCGLDKPVRVTAIGGIRLSQPATFSCDTAAATKTWIEQALIPALEGRDLVEIKVAASYVCRPRNNTKGAKISEHGRGKAIDVSGFVFADGTEWSILRNYNKQIRRAHKGACGIFGTTLGPGSDGFHEDHLHFDIAQHRGGAYCR